jgi:hypothetical protein
VLLHLLTAAFGTTRTLRDVRYTAAIRGKADPARGDRWAIGTILAVSRSEIEGMIRVSRIPGSRIDFVRIIALDASTVHEVVAGRAKRPKICRVECHSRIGFDWHFMMHGARLDNRAVALEAPFAKRFGRELALSGAVPCGLVVQAGHQCSTVYG